MLINVILKLSHSINRSNPWEAWCWPSTSHHQTTVKNPFIQKGLRSSSLHPWVWLSPQTRKKIYMFVRSKSIRDRRDLTSEIWWLKVQPSADWLLSWEHWLPSNFQNKSGSHDSHEMVLFTCIDDLMKYTSPWSKNEIDSIFTCSLLDSYQWKSSVNEREAITVLCWGFHQARTWKDWKKPGWALTLMRACLVGCKWEHVYRQSFL